LWPDLLEAASLSDEEGSVAAAAAAAGGLQQGAVRMLGHQPGSNLPVLLKRGPFGLYVQLVSERTSQAHG
jgi:topoisomerase IA-like protein